MVGAAAVSYTHLDVYKRQEYAYQNVRFLEQEPVVSEGVTIGLSVKNTGKMDGTETVQVYVKAEHSKMPHGQLKKIVKLPLCAGEEKEINIRLESEDVYKRQQ